MKIAMTHVQAIMKALGATNTSVQGPVTDSAVMGGTCRMGDDPKTSVLNQFNQTWDVKNLFVVDGAAFVSGSSKNPTGTIMALAWRASEYMMEEMRKGNL